MTREEAIRDIEECVLPYVGGISLCMAIEALKSEIEYKAKVKELEDAIAKCEKAEKEFKSRTCKFRSQTNCDFCAFHSECEEHWKEGETE